MSTPDPVPAAKKAICPRHNDTMDPTPDGFMCHDCGFTTTQAEVDADWPVTQDMRDRFKEL